MKLKNWQLNQNLERSKSGGGKSFLTGIKGFSKGKIMTSRGSEREKKIAMMNSLKNFLKKK